MPARPIDVTLMVAEVLESLGVTYMIGGSVASAVHGVVRATFDADLVAGLRPEHITPLADALQPMFYLDVQAMQDAVRCRACFNYILSILSNRFHVSS